MTRTEEKITWFIYVLFVGFLIGYLFGIFMCKKIPERFGIVPKETECSCCESEVFNNGKQDS